ncbi:MAG TPA: TonB-dependent receptor [Terriglobales bacterium]|nr:TonB-dependent receptor [Terriglobales bacterium]
MEYDFRLRITALLGVLAVIFCATFALGQGIVTGSISGTVTDPQGAVVNGAKVTATHVSTNRQFTTVSTGAGDFSLRALPIGMYDLKVEAPNYRSYESKGVGVNTGADTSLGSVKLEVGATTETVTVEGTAPLIEATTQQITNTFDAQKTASLPVGNTFDSLALFAPGVASAGDAGFSNNNGAELAVNGQRARSNNFQIDGQNNNDNSIGGPQIFFGNQDAIAELQVVTNYSAEYGRNMGAVVNYITKSGTNQFHGTAFEFYQGSKFDSLTNEEKSPLFSGPNGLPFCAPGQSPSSGACETPVVPNFVDNRFGGTLGGPIKKDKIWFFGSANFERQRTGGLPSSSAPGLVPTPTGISQLLAAFPNSPAGPLYKAVGPSAISAGSPTYSNIQNVLVTDQIDPTTGSAFDCIAAPTSPGCTPIQFGAVSRFVASPFNDYEATGRVDFKLTNRDNLFVRYVFQQQINNGINFGLGIDVGDWQQIPGRNQSVGLDWTRNWSNSFVNQARFSYSREKSIFNEGGFTSCNFGNPLACPPEILMLGALPQDETSFGVAAGFPQGRIVNVYQVQDNASKLMGKHTIKFGGEFDVQRSPNVFLPNNNSVFFFGTFSDLVANNPLQTRLTQGDPHLPFHEKDMAFYFQDDWRVKDNLTLNLGLRWEWFQQAINLLHDRSVAQQTGSSPFWDTTLPLSQTTVPHVPEDLNNFSPVVGFAWTPRILKGIFGEDKTVIRGGFRISYDPAFYNIFLNVATSAPSVNAGQFVGPLPTSGSFLGQDLSTFLTPFVPTGVDAGTRNQTTVSRNFHNPYSEQWNIGIQRSIGQKLVAEVRYVGNHGVGNFQSINGNPALTPLIDAGFSNVIPKGLTPCTTTGAPGSNAGYVDCNKRRVVERGNFAWSKYNSLQTELRMANFHGVTATASYTWSHTMDNASEIYSTVAGGNTLSFAQNPFNTDRGERGNSGIDFPNVFGLAFIYDLPMYKGQQGWKGHVLGGWQLNSTYRYSTGQPYTTVQTRFADPFSSSLCDPTSVLSGTYDACRPILSNTSLPLDSVGIYCDGTVNTCLNGSGAALPIGTLVQYGDPCFETGTCAVTPISAAHWIVNNNTAATLLGTPFRGVGRDTLRGQPISTVNFGLFKNTKLTEKVTLQLQANVFNLLNTQYRGTPDPVLDDVLAGTPPPFQSTAYNFSGGGNNLEGGGNSNVTNDGIGRRRLTLGAKIIF